MSKRKTAQRCPMVKKEPEPKRRWIVVNAKTNQPIMAIEEGFDEEKAQRLSDGYLTDTKVVPLWEYQGKPDPDLEDEA